MTRPDPAVCHPACGDGVPTGGWTGVETGQAGAKDSDDWQGNRGNGVKFADQQFIWLSPFACQAPGDQLDDR